MVNRKHRLTRADIVLRRGTISSRVNAWRRRPLAFDTTTSRKGIQVLRVITLDTSTATPRAPRRQFSPRDRGHHDR